MESQVDIGKPALVVRGALWAHVGAIGVMVVPLFPVIIGQAKEIFTFEQTW